MNFAGQHVVVTGGASGIGEACARRFAALGARVTLLDHAIDAATRIATELGGSAEHCDVSDEAAVRQTAARIEARAAVSVLAHCAGVLQRTLPPETLKMSEWDRVLQVDLRGTYLCCAAFGQAMAARGRGAIVNIASIAGMRSGPLHAYGPAKAGVISLTETLAAEWGSRGVRVNAVSPGFTLTPALQTGIDKGVLDPRAMTQYCALGRLVTADEIASAVCFLASDLASGITGVNLPVDVGYLVGTPWSSYGGLRP